MVDEAKTGIQFDTMNIDVHPHVIMSSGIVSICQSTQVDLFPQLDVGTAFPVITSGTKLRGYGADLTITGEAEYRCWGGFTGYDVYLREEDENWFSLNNDENEVISILLEETDNSHITITGVTYGYRKLLVFCTGGGSGHMRTLRFVVDDEIRDVEGEIVTVLDIVVDEVVELNFFGGVASDLTITETTGGILTISGSTPRFTVTGLAIGTTTLRAVGLNGNDHDVTVTVT